MTEYKVIKSFQMDFARKRGGKDYSDTLVVEEGQILEEVDSVDLFFRIKGTKIGLRLSPWTIDGYLEKIGT